MMVIIILMISKPIVFFIQISFQIPDSVLFVYLNLFMILIRILLNFYLNLFMIPSDVLFDFCLNIFTISSNILLNFYSNLFRILNDVLLICPNFLIVPSSNFISLLSIFLIIAFLFLL